MTKDADIIAMLPDHVAQFSSSSDGNAYLRDESLVAAIREARGCGDSEARALLREVVRAVGGDSEWRSHGSQLGGGRLVARTADRFEAFFVPWGVVR